MTRLACLLRIRLLYPHFLFKKGSRMHILFMTSLFLMLGFALFGIAQLTDMALKYYNAPFSMFLSPVIALVVLWGLMCVLVYGVTHG